MPQAALPAISMALGATGAGASAAGGKKAADKSNDLAKQQLNLQMAQWGKAKEILSQTFAPAQTYWNSLLKGGNAAVQATGPYASLIGQAGAGARTSIANNLPRGGEANLATAQSYNNTSNDISRLYAGMQPTAAGALGNLAGLSAAFSPNANTGAAASIYGNSSSNAMQAGQGFGNLAYKGAQQKKNKPSGTSTGGV